MTAPLPVLGSRDPWAGGAVAPGVMCLLAPNPGPMTLDGTNTWILSDPGRRASLVIDPGPADESHLAAIEEECRSTDCPISAILLTHGHADHSEGASLLARRAGSGRGSGQGGVPVRALDPQHRLGDEGLQAGEVVTLGDLELRVVATPGHTWDSLSFVVPSHSAVLTGDTILGRGTTVVAHPDGRLDQYLSSLEKLRTIADEHGLQRVWPGHGPALSDPVTVVRDYLVHRRARLDQVASVLEGGAGSLWEVVEIVYADVPRQVWPAAALSVAAQLQYLGRSDLIDLGD